MDKPDPGNKQTSKQKQKKILTAKYAYVWSSNATGIKELVQKMFSCPQLGNWQWGPGWIANNAFSAAPMSLPLCHILKMTEMMMMIWKGGCGCSRRVCSALGGSRPNPAPIGTGSFISHQRILDPPEITIFVRSSITRGRTGGEGQGIIMTIVFMGMMVVSMVVMQRREMVR